MKKKNYGNLIYKIQINKQIQYFLHSMAHPIISRILSIHNNLGIKTERNCTNVSTADTFGISLTLL